mmetsp:Transcript_52075/g.104290  ORF Transcript_52075/g.104290 Transcript_52075/m.104290 type:complete len:80 (+) Transcript_52075:622-861(+)
MSEQPSSRFWLARSRMSTVGSYDGGVHVLCEFDSCAAFNPKSVAIRPEVGLNSRLGSDGPHQKVEISPTRTDANRAGKK